MITGAAKVAGVVGWPVAHSLSPLIHNAWIEALGLDAVYVPFAVEDARFEQFIDGLRGGAICGLNVTLPFKTRAKRLSQFATTNADYANAANLLLFREDGRIQADNTDGEGLLSALEERAPDWSVDAGPIAVIGAGGAANGAIAALIEQGAEDIRVINRTEDKAQELATMFRLPRGGFGFDHLESALCDVTAIINATSAELDGKAQLPPFPAPPAALFMDMVYRPLRTGFLKTADARGHPTVDGLAMLIGQARPSFEAFFGVAPPPAEVCDVRALCLRALGEAP